MAPSSTRPYEPLSQAGVLSAGNFVGTFDRRAKDATYGAQATYDGAAFVAMLDRQLVGNVLAPDLQLAESTISGATQHPVILLLGKQKDLCLLEDGVLVKVDEPAYTELILVVPFTVRPPGTKWHNYVVRMYLDNIDAIVIGDVIYAYAKEDASFTERGDSMTVVHDKSTVFRSRVSAIEPASSVAPRMPLPPGFGDFQQVFEMPMVGYFGLNPPATIPKDWRFSCSYFEWDYANASVAPAESVFAFVEPFKRGMEDWVELGEMTNAPDGAFRMTGLRWRLSCELPLLPPNMPPACTFG